jgi:hypothetical protein
LWPITITVARGRRRQDPVQRRLGVSEMEVVLDGELGRRRELQGAARLAGAASRRAQHDVREPALPALIRPPRVSRSLRAVVVTNARIANSTA